VPILSVTLQGEAQLPGGQKAVVPPAAALTRAGPVVKVSITPPEAVTQPILQAGGTITPYVGLALIDTGASSTCIDEDVANTLSLPVVGRARMASATEPDSIRNQYPVQIEFVGWGVKGGANRAIGANLKPQNLVALIGRDLLNKCLLVYNGPSGSFSLAL